MIYLETSCLVKVVRQEPESRAVVRALAEESSVIVSNLAELEALIDLKGGYVSGDYSKSQWRRFEFELHKLRNTDPFHFRNLPTSIWDVAVRQHRNSGEIHCRTMDRVHLAAVELLRLNRLMTLDIAQAAAARDLGFEVIEPSE